MSGIFVRRRSRRGGQEILDPLGAAREGRKRRKLLAQDPLVTEHWDSEKACDPVMFQRCLPGGETSTYRR